MLNGPSGKPGNIIWSTIWRAQCWKAIVGSKAPQWNCFKEIHILLLSPWAHHCCHKLQVRDLICHDHPSFALRKLRSSTLHEHKVECKPLNFKVNMQQCSVSANTKKHAQFYVNMLHCNVTIEHKHTNTWALLHVWLQVVCIIWALSSWRWNLRKKIWIHRSPKS
jgi:hypothetical protein